MPVSFSDQFEASYAMVNDRVRARQATTDYGWLLTHVDGFLPDYFTIRTMGHRVGVRGLNYITSPVLGRWGMGYAVMSRLVGLFYDSLCPNEADSRLWLLHRLRQPPPGMLDWSLVEFFLFLNDWFQGQLEPILRSFESIKNTLNCRALSVVHATSAADGHSILLSQLIQVACYANWLDVILPDFHDRQSRVLLDIQAMLKSGAGDASFSTEIMAAFHSHGVIMYECDNAGEVVFDLLVVTRLIQMGKSVTIVAKQSPILNDVTVEEVHQLIASEPIFDALAHALKHRQLSVISANDFAMVGKYLPLATRTYRTAYAAADFIWLKGQANFQTMPICHFGVFKKEIQYKKPMGMGLIVKAPIVAHCLRCAGVKKASLGDPLVVLI
ncbi:MAG: ARMT1-like domain-containing protein [Candidatus Marinamargulisbacteria bacterium]